MTSAPLTTTVQAMLVMLQETLAVLRSVGTGSMDPAQLEAAIDPLETRLNLIQRAMRPTDASAASDEGDPMEPTRLRELVVERLTVVEPDGTSRLVLCGRANAPDAIVDGTTLAGRQGGNAAGVYFYNDDGDECGAIAYGGGGADGREGAGAGLFFDRYKQDQVVFLEYGERPGGQRSGLHIWDRPTIPLPEQMARIDPARALPEGSERDRAIEELWNAGLSAAPRVFVGRDEDGTALVVLRDARGRPRLRLAVDAGGVPSVSLLDEQGQPIGGIS
jgi:hypothetical protein